MRSMRINVAQFVKEYHEAVSAELTTVECAKLLGVHVSTLSARVSQCRKRGINLPLLRDQRARLDRIEAAAQRRAVRENRKAEREARRKLRNMNLATFSRPAPAPTPSVDIEALSDRVADKVFDRLRDTLRFQFFVGPEIPA